MQRYYSSLMVLESGCASVCQPLTNRVTNDQEVSER